MDYRLRDLILNYLLSNTQTKSGMVNVPKGITTQELSKEAYQGDRAALACIDIHAAQNLGEVHAFVQAETIQQTKTKVKKAWNKAERQVVRSEKIAAKICLQKWKHHNSANLVEELDVIIIQPATIYGNDKDTLK